ncbi:MAG: sodium-dependent transporter [Armatimonadota bacterium]|nr:sodium-dependent transporter [Armatimonadota bacterium]MDR7451022.1 sodium-dependent transporter [Armatimonadota bacterium]MDR7465957.1 sodium-dependent transporter [Armatimonadota bacterium]MDR7494022.1 sodium-dependent transporter [Armatimonadota bacterium]MDR7498472.1 sodium-dependent transporter [Armatimonadota bacterium]
MGRGATERWGSRVGFVLATAGSAVGLGNIWRFPSMAADNGGGAFVLLFLVLILVVGIPGLIAELVLGRHTHRNPVDAFLTLRPRSLWGAVGALSVAAAFLILSYYSVIAGWVLAYVGLAASGDLAGLDPAGLGHAYARLAGHPWHPVAWHGAFLVITAVVVISGVQRGIERWAKILMPGLILMLGILALRVLSWENALTGAAWLIQPRWAEITWQTLLRAMGQVFFSFGLGMGVMITYGSYLEADEDIPRSALYVATADAGIALLSALIVIPALFAFDRPVEGGPGLLFVTLPGVLNEMPLGRLLNVVFFAMVAVAALTSAISLLEVVVAFLVQGQKWTRQVAVASATIAIFLAGIPSALSPAAVPIAVRGRDFLTVVDGLASDLLLPLGGLCTAIFVGWIWGTRPALVELRRGAVSFRPSGLWAASVRLIIPVAVGLILLAGLLGVR